MPHFSRQTCKRWTQQYQKATAGLKTGKAAPGILPWKRTAGRQQRSWETLEGAS